MKKIYFQSWFECCKLLLLMRGEQWTWNKENFSVRFLEDFAQTDLRNRTTQLNTSQSVPQVSLSIDLNVYSLKHLGTTEHWFSYSVTTRNTSCSRSYIFRTTVHYPFGGPGMKYILILNDNYWSNDIWVQLNLLPVSHLSHLPIWWPRQCRNVSTNVVWTKYVRFARVWRFGWCRSHRYRGMSFTQVEYCKL